MEPFVLRMPDIGEGIAEVEIVGWHVRPGDEVVEDQVLVDVMTDKASVEIPSPVTGRIASLGGAEGDVLAVGAPLLVLVPQGVPVPAVADTPETPEAAMPAEPSPPLVQPPPAGISRPYQGVSTGVPASPSVRRRARQLGIDLAGLRRDGRRDGPVSHRELDEYLLARTRQMPPGDAEAPDPAVAPTRIRVTGLRRRIAQRMLESSQGIPHFAYVEEVDVTALESLRQSLNAEPDQDIHLGLLPFLVRALVLALAEHPGINAHFDAQAEEIIQFDAVHLGLAVHTAKGLMVPVLHDAHRLDPWSCAERIRSLSEAARQGRAQREQLTGSTLTLSSLGALGGVAATPIINPPEVAIVGVNRRIARPVVHEGRVVVRQMMNLSSSFDHRVVDGMHAARFIQDVRRRLETPALLFVGGWP
ncbi:MAG: dihydrolipoamide acetyltransferase family protein [Castellaniella sp.]